ncbi:hypothetical protein MUK42_11190 [Musa troglodytarum]|uniref:Uncharacterized protein n=1 Tax=Musa troglodytarum TaxID=320322 RepID=A0A9E7K6P0_9LILI|nr:hypothetical protein MUK42_11190 [Musa troglodytarum]
MKKQQQFVVLISAPPNTSRDLSHPSSDPHFKRKPQRQRCKKRHRISLVSPTGVWL